MTVLTPRVVRSVRDLRKLRSAWHPQTVGLVPTMGALHEGHLLLVRQLLAANDRTVVLVFVNPLQFAPHEDLDAYPRTMERDLAALAATSVAGRTVDAVFAPGVLDMYPAGVPLDVKQQQGAFVSVLGVLEQLEGVVRPHFFRGVATVVTKLLNAVAPTRAYFGQKDVQQTVVVRRLVQDLLMPVEIVVGDIVRDANGLALLSRNEYLLPETKELASCISRGVRAVEQAYHAATGPVAAADLLAAFHATLAPYTDGTLARFAVEYACITTSDTLAPLATVTDSAVFSTVVVVPTAAGATARLLDNTILAK